jgi:hypothetical protein
MVPGAIGIGPFPRTVLRGKQIRQHTMREAVLGIDLERPVCVIGCLIKAPLSAQTICKPSVSIGITGRHLHGNLEQGQGIIKPVLEENLNRSIEVPVLVSGATRHGYN